MAKFKSIFVLVLCALIGFFAVSPLEASAQQHADMAYTGQVNVYSISGNSYLRGCGRTGNLSDLGSDEFLSYCLLVENNSGSEYTWDSAYVQVDGGEAWHWAAGSMPAGSSVLFHIYHQNMQTCLEPGEHMVTWYFNNQQVHYERFLITQDMNWASVFPIPSDAEIENHNRSSSIRSPYLYGWLSIPAQTRYTEYMVDFKADHLPNGTYCCLSNWTMDYSSLERQYQSVWTEYDSIHAYAGFQSLQNGEKVGIMSFWDVYCQDASGRVTTIRAKRVYPETTNHTEDFGGEGTGAHCIVPYPWEADHWYRMHLICSTSPQTGNTVVDQWVCDLETGAYTLLCSYDTGVAGATFKGSTAIFLENFVTEYSGDVRTMEVCNAWYLDADTNQWYAIREAYIGSDGGLPRLEGSYSFGTADNRFWMITSGVGGDWFGNGKGRSADYFTVD